MPEKQTSNNKIEETQVVRIEILSRFWSFLNIGKTHICRKNN